MCETESRINFIQHKRDEKPKDRASSKKFRTNEQCVSESVSKRKIKLTNCWQAVKLISFWFADRFFRCTRSSDRHSRANEFVRCFFFGRFSLSFFPSFRFPFNARARIIAEYVNAVWCYLRDWMWSQFKKSKAETHRHRTEIDAVFIV